MLKGVIEAVQSKAVDRSWMGHLIEDVKVELQAVVHWQLTFVTREGNKLAHDLAKYAWTHFLQKLGMLCHLVVFMTRYY
jgi:hypothetical protein